MKECILFFKQFGLYYLAVIICLVCIRSSMAMATDSLPSPKVEKTIKGKVTDEDDLPLPGVNVVVQNTMQGTVTDADGNYTLNVPDNVTVLVFSFVGYVSKSVEIGTRGTINVSLVPDVQQLQEVVVVGYGTQKRSDITGSVYSIPEERLQQLPNNNIAQALQGAIPGISISTNGTSAEGNNVSISIRGRSSINASNTPLIVLDGIIYEGSISDINTNDIKSMEVLKDASSTAIYGSRGANGVILITTRKGRSGKMSINYDLSYGISNAVNIPDILTPEEFYQFKYDRDSASFTASEIAVHDAGGGVDWLDEALRTGKRTQHTLSVSGGSDQIRYYVSAAYLNVEGISLGDKFDRYTFRTNLDADITDWLTLSTNTQFSLVDRSGLGPNFTEAFYSNPLATVRDPNADLTIHPWPDEIFDNPLSNLNAVNENHRYKLFTNNSMNIKIPFVKGLEYKLNTGVEFTYNPSSTYYGRNTGRGFDSNGESVVSTYHEHNYLLENILSYKREFDKHRLFLTALYSYQTYERNSRSLTGTLFPTDFLTTYQNDVAGLLEPNDSYQRWDLISSMARINYGYDGRYLLTLTVRRDGYSAFGANKKFGIFPSAAVAWNIHNESFFGENDIVSNLKLRLSYGVNGNQSIDPYSSLALLNERSYVNDQVVAGGYIPFSLGTPDLSWETSKTANIGVDFGFAKSRVTGSLDYYRKTTTDLLLKRAISSIHGSQRDYVFQNVGEVLNKGVELGIKADVLQVSDFVWNAQVTASYNRNEIVDLYGDQKSDTLNRWFIGKPIEVNYHYVFDGVYQLNDDLDDTPLGSVEAGWAKIKDLNGDGTITADGDFTVQGQTDPKFIFGFGNTFTYKGLSLYVFLQGATGVTRRNPFLRDDVFIEVRRNTTRKQWWTGENPTNAYWSNDYDSNQKGVQIFEDASFLRVKDVSLSYNLPLDLIGKIGLSSLKVYTSTRNLWTFTDYGGLDPEFPVTLSGGGEGQRASPLQREFIFGLNIGF